MRTYVVLRAGALVIAAVTALLLMVGDHPPEFVVADLLVVTLLVLAALLPSGRLGLVALAAGFGVGLGVFTVAFAASVDRGAVSWALASAVVGCLAGISVAVRETRPAPQR